MGRPSRRGNPLRWRKHLADVAKYFAEGLPNPLFASLILLVDSKRVLLGKAKSGEAFGKCVGRFDCQLSDVFIWACQAYKVEFLRLVANWAGRDGAACSRVDR